jgi:hypothetical protein
MTNQQVGDQKRKGNEAGYECSVTKGGYEQQGNAKYETNSLEKI